MTDQGIHDWKAAAWRPDGQHQAALVAGAKPGDLALRGSLGTLHPVTARKLTGADTLRGSLNLLPRGLDVYASYVDNFGGFPELLAMRDRLNPHAVYFSYTIFGNPAHFADIEPGAMHASDLARGGMDWLRTRGIPLPGNRVPGVYTSAGNAEEVFAAVGLQNLKHDELPSDFIYQSAHYGAGPHICHPNTCGYRAAHGTQWDLHGPNGENFDRALWLPGALGGNAAPAQPKPEDEMLTAVVSAEGHLHVFRENPDGSVDFTYQKKGERTWLGGEAGKHIANFAPFAPARGK